MLFDLLAVREESRIGGLAWHYRICQGFPVLAAYRTAKALEVPIDALGELIGASPQQLAWAHRGQSLESCASDALFRIARAFSQLHAIFKSEEACAQWLKAPQKDLGDKIPLGLLLSAPGTAEVIAAIDRLRLRQRAKFEVVAEEREAQDNDPPEDRLDPETTQEEEVLHS